MRRCDVEYFYSYQQNGNCFSIKRLVSWWNACRKTQQSQHIDQNLWSVWIQIKIASVAMTKIDFVSSNKTKLKIVWSNRNAYNTTTYIQMNQIDGICWTGRQNVKYEMNKTTFRIHNVCFNFTAYDLHLAMH